MSSPGLESARTTHAAQRHRLGCVDSSWRDPHRQELSAQPPSLRVHATRPRAGGRAAAPGRRRRTGRAILALLRRTTGSDSARTSRRPSSGESLGAWRWFNVETLEEYAGYLEGHADEAQACTRSSSSRSPPSSATRAPSSPVARGPASAAEGPSAGRSGAGVGAGCATARGLLDRHLPSEPRRAGTTPPSRSSAPTSRGRRGEGAVGTVPAADRPGRLAGTPAAVLHRGGRRLPVIKTIRECASSRGTT